MAQGGRRLKVVLLGSGGVGKSAITLRVVRNEFESSVIHTCTSTYIHMCTAVCLDMNERVCFPHIHTLTFVQYNPTVDDSFVKLFDGVASAPVEVEIQDTAGQVHTHTHTHETQEHIHDVSSHGCAYLYRM